MSRHLAHTVAAYALLLAAWAVLRAVTGRGAPPPLLVSLLFLEGVLVVAALVEVVRLAGGGDAAEPATHAGYLLASVVVLPLALSNTSEDRDTPWDGAILAVGAAAVAVVALRLQVTGG